MLRVTLRGMPPLTGANEKANCDATNQRRNSTNPRFRRMSLNSDNKIISASKAQGLNHLAVTHGDMGAGMASTASLIDDADENMTKTPSTTRGAQDTGEGADGTEISTGSTEQRRGAVHGTCVIA